MAHYSFEYLPVNCTTGWQPKARTWRTQLGAEKAATKWERDMASEGCEIATRIVEIVNGRTIIVKGVPYVMAGR